MTLRPRRKFLYDGELLGQSYDDLESGEIVFIPEKAMDERKTRDLLERISTDHLLHLRDSARAVYKLCRHFGVDFQEYIIDADIQEHVLARSFQDIEDVRMSDKHLYKMIKSRGLEDYLKYACTFR